MATPLFLLSQLRSGCRSVRKSSHPGAGAPVLAATMTSKDILMLHNDDNCVYTYMMLRSARTRMIADIARQGYTKQGQFLSRSTGPLLPLAASERYIATLALPRDQDGLRPEDDAGPRPRKRPRAFALVHRHPRTPHTDQESLRPHTDAGPRPRKRPSASLHTQCNHSLPPRSRHQRHRDRSEWTKKKRTAPSLLRRGPTQTTPLPQNESMIAARPAHRPPASHTHGQALWRRLQRGCSMASRSHQQTPTRHLPSPGCETALRNQTAGSASGIEAARAST